MRVLVFGDSIAQGFWDSEGGWAARLRKHYDGREIKENQNLQPTVYNLSVSGDSTKNVLARLENETEHRLWPGEEIAYVFAIGINDTVYRGQEFESTPEKYQEQLNEILRIAKKFSKKFLFVGLTSVVDERVQPLQWSDSGKCYSNQRVLLFEQTLQRFCQANSVPCVNVFEKLTTEQKLQELMPDGVHPNDVGHELIFKLVQPELDKLINGPSF